VLFGTVSLKPDRKTTHTTAQINSDGRVSRITTRPHDRAGSHLTTKSVTCFGDLVSNVQTDMEKDRVRSIGNCLNIHCAMFALNIPRSIVCNLFP